MASDFNSNSLNQDNSHSGSGIFLAIVIIFALIVAAIVLVNYGDGVAEWLVMQLSEFTQEIPTYP